MSYKLSNTASGLAGCETLVVLDSGQDVAVSYVASTVAGNGRHIAATARVVDATGATVKDALGHEITSTASHSFCAEHIQQFGLAACIKDVMHAALGEPPQLKSDDHPLLSVDSGILAAWSIRVTIANAKSITATHPSSILQE